MLAQVLYAENVTFSTGTRGAINIFLAHLPGNAVIPQEVVISIPEEDAASNTARQGLVFVFENESMVQQMVQQTERYNKWNANRFERYVEKMKRQIGNVQVKSHDPVGFFEIGPDETEARCQFTFFRIGACLLVKLVDDQSTLEATAITCKRDYC